MAVAAVTRQHRMRHRRTSSHDRQTPRHRKVLSARAARNKQSKPRLRHPTLPPFLTFVNSSKTEPCERPVYGDIKTRRCRRRVSGWQDGVGTIFFPLSDPDMPILPQLPRVRAAYRDRRDGRHAGSRGVTWPLRLNKEIKFFSSPDLLLLSLFQALLAKKKCGTIARSLFSAQHRITRAPECVFSPRR